MLAVGTVVLAAGDRLAVGVGGTANKAAAPPLYLLASPLEQPCLMAGARARGPDGLKEAR